MVAISFHAFTLLAYAQDLYLEILVKPHFFIMLSWPKEIQDVVLFVTIYYKKKNEEKSSKRRKERGKGWERT
jgi:hypothetical protein